MRLVIIESPWRALTEEERKRNRDYALIALRDSLDRGEAPQASHLLHTQVLNDRLQPERDLGIEAGLEWANVAECMVLYVDRGLSPGMKSARDFAKAVGLPVEQRSLSLVEQDRLRKAIAASVGF